MPTELLSTERASVIATICFFLDFFLIIVILTSLETVFLAQLFRNLQHKIDARWAVLINLYYIRFPKISRGQIARKKERFSQFLNCTFVADGNVFVALQTQKSGQMARRSFPPRNYGEHQGRRPFCPQKPFCLPQQRRSLPAKNKPGKAAALPDLQI